jgi:hypothetical protein
MLKIGIKFKFEYLCRQQENLNDIVVFFQLTEGMNDESSTPDPSEF